MGYYTAEEEIGIQIELFQIELKYTSSDKRCKSRDEFFDSL